MAFGSVRSMIISFATKRIIFGLQNILKEIQLNGVTMCIISSDRADVVIGPYINSAKRKEHFTK